MNDGPQDAFRGWTIAPCSQWHARSAALGALGRRTACENRRLLAALPRANRLSTPPSALTSRPRLCHHHTLAQPALLLNRLAPPRPPSPSRLRWPTATANQQRPAQRPPVSTLAALALVQLPSRTANRLGCRPQLYPRPPATLTGWSRRALAARRGNSSIDLWAARGGSSFTTSKRTATTWRYCRPDPNEPAATSAAHVFVLLLSRHERASVLWDMGHGGDETDRKRFAHPPARPGCQTGSPTLPDPALNVRRVMFVVYSYAPRRPRNKPRPRLSIIGAVWYTVIAMPSRSATAPAAMAQTVAVLLLGGCCVTALEARPRRWTFPRQDLFQPTSKLADTSPVRHDSTLSDPRPQVVERPR
jgi:hypothetical protein